MQPRMFMTVSKITFRPGLITATLSLATLLGAPSLRAGNLYVPNGSFESQPTTFADPRIDAWQKAAQPGTFDTNTFGAWDNLAGVFMNSPAGYPGNIDNAAGDMEAIAKHLHGVFVREGVEDRAVGDAIAQRWLVG